MTKDNLGDKWGDKLDNTLNDIFDSGVQTLRASYIKGNRIDFLEFREKATSEAKAKITKLIAQARLDELHRYAQRRTDSEIPYFEARLKELRLQGEE